MSSKKFVYLLMTVAIVCGLIAGGTAHGQSTGSFNIKGTVLNADGASCWRMVIEVRSPGFCSLYHACMMATYAITFVGNILGLTDDYHIGGIASRVSVGHVIELLVKMVVRPLRQQHMTVTYDTFWQQRVRSSKWIPLILAVPPPKSLTVEVESIRTPRRWSLDIGDNDKC